MHLLFYKVYVLLKEMAEGFNQFIIISKIINLKLASRVQVCVFWVSDYWIYFNNHFLGLRLKNSLLIYYLFWLITKIFFKT